MLAPRIHGCAPPRDPARPRRRCSSSHGRNGSVPRRDAFPSPVNNVRNHTARAGRGRSAASGDDHRPPLLRVLGWGAKDAAGVMLVAFATGAILVNVLFMQSGSHPAPMFRGAMASAKPVPASDGAPPAAAVPRARPAEPAAATPAPLKAAATRTPGEIIGDIQRELARRGYYDGVVDGLYGPKTDGAIRDFEQAAGLKPSTEPNEALLQAIARASAKLAKAPTAAAPAARPTAARADVPAERPAPSKRIVALQRALAEYGYGQIKPSGMMDADTQSAIERFERERKLPITGQASDRVVRELAAMTGRPLE
jgi:peptidoglycan hydrolase-like protein with peptidoglycan-binding domain